MPLPLLGAVAAVGKGLVVGAAKAATVGAKVGAKAAVSSGKFFAKGGANLARGGAKVARQGGKQVVKGAKFFKQKVGNIQKRGGNIANKLKENATNLREFLKRQNKNQDKLRTKKQQRKKRTESINKKREKEKKLEANKSSSSSSNQKKTERNLAKSPLNIFNKLFAFGGLLLGGILVNAFEGLKKKAEEFYENNKELFDTIGNFLSSVKDSAVDFFNSFTGPYTEKGAFDNIAKFDDSGKLQGGALREVEKAFEGIDKMIIELDKVVGGDVVLAMKGGVEGILSKRTGIFVPQKFTEKERERYMQQGGQTLTSTESISSSQQPSTTHSGQYGPLFEVISRGEGGVNSVNRGNAGDTPGGAKSIFGRNLTDMTVDEIYAAQRSGRVFAVGKFQIIDITMPGFIKYLKSRGIDTSTAKFTEKIQDYFKPYVVNYKRPIVGKYLRGESNNRAEAAQALAREFASIGASYPETIPGYQPADRGDTLYGGRGNNRASISPAKIEAALDAAKITPKPKITPVPDKEDQARVINQPDPTDEEVATLFIQRVNTIQYVPVPVTA